MPLPADLEPVPRDPKKLNRTAWILVAIMLIGGLLVLKAYEKWAVKQSADTRPSIVSRIPKERDLRIIRQDGKSIDLFDLRGKVWVVNVVSLKNDNALSHTVMKKMSETFAQTPDFHLVSLAVEPVPAEAVVGALAAFAEKESIALPQWWLGTNEPGTLHKFIKNELKSNVHPHEEAGKWVYDTSIVLIDRKGHLRRAVVPQRQGGPPYVATFDFEQAAKWDSEGKKTGTSLSNVQELESLLEKTIRTLLAETAETP